MQVEHPIFLMEQYQKSFIMEQKKENGMVQNADEQKEEKPEKKEKFCQPFDGKSVFSEIKKRNRKQKSKKNWNDNASVSDSDTLE